MEQSERDPNLDDRCPLCERSLAEDPHVPDYCDACGCLLVEASPRDGGDALPPGVTRPGEPLPTEGDAHDPYRAAATEARLDILVAHRQQQFQAAAVSAALFIIGVVARDLPDAVKVGIVALALGGLGWSLIPRKAAMRFIAAPDGLTVVGDGVPLHHGQRFAAAEVDGLFVRALARAERAEDRRLELVLLDRHGGRHTLLRGIDDPGALSWVARHVERALGFPDTAVAAPSFTRP